MRLLLEDRDGQLHEVLNHVDGMNLASPWAAGEVTRAIQRTMLRVLSAAVRAPGRKALPPPAPMPTRILRVVK